MGALLTGSRADKKTCQECQLPVKFTKSGDGPGDLPPVECPNMPIGESFSAGIALNEQEIALAPMK
jgi:hypothetical protein